MFDKIKNWFHPKEDDVEGDIELGLVSIPPKDIFWEATKRFASAGIGLLVAGAGIAGAAIGFSESATASGIISVVIASVGTVTAITGTILAGKTIYDKDKIRKDLNELAEAQTEQELVRFEELSIDPGNQLRSMFDELIATEFKQNEEYLSLNKIQKKAIANFYKVLNRAQWKVTRVRINNFIKHYPTESKLDFYFHRAKANLYLRDYKSALEDCTHYLLHDNNFILAHLLQGNIYYAMANNNNPNIKLEYGHKAKYIYENLLRQLGSADRFQQIENLLEEIWMHYEQDINEGFHSELENDSGSQQFASLLKELMPKSNTEVTQDFIKNEEINKFYLPNPNATLSNIYLYDKDRKITLPFAYIYKKIISLMSAYNKARNILDKSRLKSFQELVKKIDAISHGITNFRTCLGEVMKIKKMKVDKIKEIENLFNKIKNEINWLQMIKQHPILYAAIVSGLGMTINKIGSLYHASSTKRDYYEAARKYFQESITIMNNCMLGEDGYPQYDNDSKRTMKTLISYLNYFKAMALGNISLQENNSKEAKNVLHEALLICDQEEPQIQVTTVSLDMVLNFTSIKLWIYGLLAGQEEDNLRKNEYYKNGYQIVLALFNNIIKDSKIFGLSFFSTEEGRRLRTSIPIVGTFFDKIVENNPMSFAFWFFTAKEVELLKKLVGTSIKKIQALKLVNDDYKSVSFVNEEIGDIQQALANINTEEAKNLSAKLLTNSKLKNAFSAFSNNEKSDVLYFIGRFLHDKYWYEAELHDPSCDYKQPIEYFKQSLKCNPNQHYAFYFMMDLYAKNGKFEEFERFVITEFIDNHYLRLNEINRCYIDIYYAQALFNLGYPLNEVKDRLRRAEEFTHQYPELQNDINELKELIDNALLLQASSKKLEEIKTQYRKADEKRQQAFQSIHGQGLSDRQILSDYDKITSTDQSFDTKKTIFQLTLYLTQLRYTQLQHKEAILRILMGMFKTPTLTLYHECLSENTVPFYLRYNKRKIYFNETRLTTDKWRALHAAGTVTPKQALEQLKENRDSFDIDNPIITYIQHSIYNNYLTSLASEHADGFKLNLVDKDGENIQNKIDDFQAYLKTIDSTKERAIIFIDFMDYLARADVQKAYISYLIEKGYADYNVVAACLSNSPELFQVSKNGHEQLSLFIEELMFGSVKEGAIHRSIIINKLDKAGLHYISMPGDGHCLYNSVGIYLEESIESLRNRVADHLDENRQEFKDFIILSKGKSLDDYVHAIRNSNEWADNIEIEILMRVLNRPILIIRPNNQIANLNDIERFKGEPIFIYYNGVNHYDGLKVKKGFNVQSVLANLQSSMTQVNEHIFKKEPSNSQIESKKVETSCQDFNTELRISVANSNKLITLVDIGQKNGELEILTDEDINLEDTSNLVFLIFYPNNDLMATSYQRLVIDFRLFLFNSLENKLRSNSLNRKEIIENNYKYGQLDTTDVTLISTNRSSLFSHNSPKRNTKVPSEEVIIIEEPPMSTP